MKFIKPLLYALVFVSFAACVDPYAVQILSTKSYLFVEGSVTNAEKQSPITIIRTDPTATFRSLEFSNTIIADIKNKNIAVAKANVTVIENENNVIQLTETSAGVYDFPKGFRGKVENFYQLRIETADGEVYVSNDEIMPEVPPIKKIYASYNEKGIRQPNFYGERIATDDIYIDFDDPAGQKNFYTWQWIQYESQLYCASCKSGRYYLEETASGGVDGSCIEDTRLNVNTYYDYLCEGNCYEIFYGSNIDILSDVYTNGKSQIAKLVAQVPVYQRNPALVVIEQRSLTPNAFRYLKLIQDQSVSTGTLVDTPPAPIRSNIVNQSNSGELVLGFFTASAIAEKRFMLERKAITNVLQDNLFIFQNSREAVVEPLNIVRPSFPNAFCKPGRNRTPFTPKGWATNL